MGKRNKNFSVIENFRLELEMKMITMNRKFNNKFERKLMNQN